MERHGLSVGIGLLVFLASAATAQVDGRTGNVEPVKSITLPVVPVDLLEEYDKRPVPEWLRCPRFFTKDSRRTEMDTRKPGDIARMVREIAANEGAAFRLGGYWGGEVYFQSKVAPHAPGLGSMDFLREGTEEGKRLGVRIVMYMNPSAVYPNHPLHDEIVARRPNGEPTDYERLGATVICTNHPKYREFLSGVLEEAFTNYELNGLYVDGLSPHRCCCEYCRAKYRKMWNEDMPLKKLEDVREWWALWEMVSQSLPVGDPADPDMERYRQFLDHSQPDITQIVHDTVKRCNPEAVILFHTWPKPSTIDYYDGTLTEIYVKRPWIHKAWKYGELANLGTMFDVPSLCNIYLEHNTAAEARYKMFQVLANGAFPNCWHFQGMETIFEYQRKNATYYDFARTNPVPFLLFPREIHLSEVHRKRADQEKLGYQGSLEHFILPGIGLYAAVTRSGLPVINVHAADFEQDLSRSRVLCLSQLAGMSREQAESVRRFVANGGGLIATHESSLIDNRAERKSDFMLADVFGASYGGTLVAAERQIRFTDDESTAVSADRPPALPHNEAHLLVKPTTGRVAAWLQGEGVPLKGAPAMVVTRFGRGRVVYLPGRLDLAEAKEPSPAIERLFASAVRWVAQDELPVEIQTDDMIGVSLYDQPERRLLHLVSHNSDSQLRTDEVRPAGQVNIRLRIPTGRRVTRVHTLWNKREVPFQIDDEWLTAELNPMGQYEVFVVELENGVK